MLLLLLANLTQLPIHDSISNGTPRDAPSSRRRGREFGEDCLSARSSNVFIHIEREFHSRRPRRAAQGDHDQWRGTGAAFSLATLLLAAQKKVASCRAAPGDREAGVKEESHQHRGCPPEI